MKNLTVSPLVSSRLSAPRLWAAASLILLASAQHILAQTTYTWDGGGANNNINTALNYVSDTYAAGAANFYVFSDGSLRNTVTANNNPIGQLIFGGDAFTFNLTTGLDINPSVIADPSILFNTSNLITFGGNQITIRRNISGTGTGTLLFNNVVSLTDNDRTWNSNGTIVLNNATGTASASGPTRLLTLGGQQKVIVNNTSGSGLAANGISVASGTVLGGSGILTPGNASNTRNITVASGGRLSAGDNYHTGDDVGTLTMAFGNSSGRLILNPGALFTFDLATTAASDRINITSGGLTLNGQEFSDFTFNPLTGFGIGVYTLFESVLTTGSLGTNLTGTIGGLDASIYLDGHNVMLSVVPEPSTYILLTLGVGTLIWLRHGRRT